MRLKISLALAWGVAFGLSIGFPAGWAISQFHAPSHPPHVEVRQEAPKEGAAHIVQEPEGWGAPLVILTGILCLVTGALAWYTRGLFKQTATLARDTHDASEAALKASTEATKLATREFISTHRPKLRVRKVTLYPLVDKAPVTVQYEIANVGGTEAVLTSATVTTEIRLRDVGAGRFTQETTIQPGATFLVRFDTSLNWRDNSYTSKYDLTIRGEVRYRDTNGLERRTEFERFPHIDTNQFVRAEKPDPDYEYED
jgi:hypothetical protein